MNDLPNLQKWCDAYKEKTSMKVHPQAAPTDVLIDEILGTLESLRNYYNNLVSIYNDLNERVTAIEVSVFGLTGSAGQVHGGGGVTVHKGGVPGVTFAAVGVGGWGCAEPGECSPPETVKVRGEDRLVEEFDPPKKPNKKQVKK